MATRCTHTTTAGQPCKAWAIRDPSPDGQDPPTCIAHTGRRSGPVGNQNARQHGFYASALDPEELNDLMIYSADMTLDDEIACARVALRRILTLLDSPNITNFQDPADSASLTHADYARLMSLALQATRTIARLLRDQRALSGAAADGILGAISLALDELGTEWGLAL